MDWQLEKPHSGFDQFMQDIAWILGPRSGVDLQQPPVKQPHAQPPSQPSPEAASESPSERRDHTGQDGRRLESEPPTPLHQSQRYILVGVGLLLAMGAILSYGVESQGSSITPPSGKTDRPSAPATVEPPSTQRSVATPPPARAPSEKPSASTVKETPIVASETTEARTTATKPRAIAILAKISPARMARRWC